MAGQADEQEEKHDRPPVLIRRRGSFMAYRAQISTTQDLLSEAGNFESGPVVTTTGGYTESQDLFTVSARHAELTRQGAPAA
jgi:hypothetical protein